MILRIAVLCTAALLAASPALAVAFARADSNGDGLVSYSEARRVMPRLAEITFEKCDRDRDGLLTEGEFTCLDSIYAIDRLPDR